MSVSTSRSFVLGLTGQPGTGKTTVARLLTGLLPNARHVAYDDFQSVTAMSFEEIEAWFASGGDCNRFILTALEDELDRRTRSDAATVIVFETPFGRLHRGTARFIDSLVWIDTPLDIALARNVRKFVEAELQRGRPTDGFLRWLEAYLANYNRLIAKMYRRQSEDIRPGADLIVDGTTRPEAIAKIIAAHVANQGLSGSRGNVV